MPLDLHHLRQHLRERFPEAHQDRPSPAPLQPSSRLPPFPAGAVSELSPAGPASGLALVLAELLDRGGALQAPSPSHNAPPSAPTGTFSPPPTELCSLNTAHRPPPTDYSPPTSDLCPLTSETPFALIDGRDSFDPASYGPASCTRLLWVRCRHADQSLRCADLLLRDGNLPLLVLDLQLNPLAELRRIPASSWYRLRNLAQQSGAALLVFTPKPLVPCAALQLTFSSAFSLTDLDRAREELPIVRYEEQQAVVNLP